YLSYLRDRLLVARELLTETGSCFVQISDENIHLVRCLLDEVFESQNFISLISFTTTSGFPSKTLSRAGDYIIWYSKSIENIKYRQLFRVKKVGDEGATKYKRIGSYKSIPKSIFSETDFATVDSITSQGETSTDQRFLFKGKEFMPPKGMHWKTTVEGLTRLDRFHRLVLEGNSIRFIRLLSDYPVFPVNNLWTDVAGVQNRIEGKVFVVQTSTEIIKRCLLMSTDPGDLVLDPTCGSGTTAYVAEQWGRRWITIDTSRIALNIAKTRLMTATFPYYYLNSDVEVHVEHKDGKIKKTITESADLHGNVRQGFVYEEVPHITLKSLANDEPPESETLFDQPYADKRKLRVTGPFTVETLQNYEPVSPDDLAATAAEDTEMSGFEERVFEHLKSAGVKNGIRNEHAVFIRVDRLTGAFLHAEGIYLSAAGEKKAYFHIGPKFGTVSRKAVNEAIKECRQKGDADWLVILGFSFESDIINTEQSRDLGIFQVTKVRMHDDLMQDGLLKKDRKAGSFITIGEPDITLHTSNEKLTVEIRGLDIYDPVKDEVKARSLAEIAYWMVDDDYDGNNFVVKQVFFCGGDRDEFERWRKGLESLAPARSRKNAEKTLRIEIDEEAFDRLYGYTSHPIEIKSPEQKIAVRVVSQFGEESMRVIRINQKKH
ncbi:MAG: site-specific DNA-methyltransferase, partial [Bacteroidales bacterium]|nr:site-specific DNA-methyltransferase [Bacteroidales bacterium]